MAVTNRSSTHASSWLLLWAFVASGCNSDDTALPSYLSTTTDGVGQISVAIVDGPVDAKNVWVTIKALDVRPCSGGGWIGIDVDSVTLDLLLLQNGVSANLIDGVDFAVGAYCELRLVIEDSATLVLNSGVEAPLKIPSAYSSGIKFKGEFNIIPNLETSITIDFDAEKSIHEKGNGNYSMDPVVVLKSVAYDSPEGYAMPGANPLDFVSFTVTPETSGTFQLPGGAELHFVEGSVANDIEITATRWVPTLNDARSDIYVFSPATEFLIPPRLEMPTTGGIVPTMSLDYEDLPTDVDQAFEDSYRVSADLGHFSCAAAVTRFEGFPNSNWYSDPIMMMDMNGVFDRAEFPNNYFKSPLAPMKREEVVALFARSIFGVEAEYRPELDSDPFLDVPKEHKFAKYIDYMNEEWVIDGCGNGSSFCMGALNRAEIAKIAVKAYARSGHPEVYDIVEKYSKPIGLAKEFADVHCMPNTKCPWFYGYVYVARELGIMTGDGQDVNTFRPADEVSRVEGAKIACFLAYGKGGCGACNVIHYVRDPAVEYAVTMFAKSNYDSDKNQFADYEQANVADEGWNCTNFTSQCLLAGLLRSADPAYVFDNRSKFKDSGGTYEWYYTSGMTKGEAWAGVDALREYAVHNKAENAGLHFDLVATITEEDWGGYMSIQEGDVAIVDYHPDGDDKTRNDWDHAAVVTRIDQDDNFLSRIYVTQQSDYATDRPMREIGEGSPNRVFEVYRPTFYRK